MFVSSYYKPSLFNAHTMILIVHIFININKFWLNCERSRQEKGARGGWVRRQTQSGAGVVVEEGAGWVGEKTDSVWCWGCS